MTTEAILLSTLAVIRKQGWDPRKFDFTGPCCIRKAISEAINAAWPPNTAIHDDNVRARSAANLAAVATIATALGQPLGSVMHWEGEPGRSQAEVESVLEKAIAGCRG